MKLPHLKQLTEAGKHWELIKPYKVSVAFGHAPAAAWIVKVDRGFQTDLATIPRWAWPLVGAPHHFTGPAIVHDLLCRESRNFADRCVADAAFLRMLRTWKVGCMRRFAMYLALRLYAYSGLWKNDSETKVD